jgi:phage tail sheath protein FI
MRITSVSNEPRPAVAADLSVAGVVGTAPNADPLIYPLNQPVLIFSDDTVALTALGTTGTLPDAVTGINDQLGDFQVAAKVVIVRVEAGGDDDATITNIVGSQASKTGIWALPEAGPILGVIPRLIAAPGFTAQQKTGISAIAMTVLGTGYVSAPTVAFSGGGGTGAAGTAVLTNGITLAVTTPGTGYTVAPTLTISAPPPGGVQATATVTVNAGALQTITVTNPGTGYVTAPTVTITGAGTVNAFLRTDADAIPVTTGDSFSFSLSVRF